MQGSLRLKKIREKFKFRDTSLYLVVGMICMLLYSLLLPLFSVPDDLYHFDCSTYISNTVIDRSYISLDKYGYPDYIRKSIKNKRYINDLFFTKIHKIDKKKVIDDRAKSQKKFEFFGHIIPAIGIKLGYLIYPSIGVMITFSRIFSGFIYLLCLYFIIKKIKYGKKLFMAVSLTPTMLPLLASMNYDGLSFVISAFFLMIVINLSVKNKIHLRDLLTITIASFFLLFFAKKNMIILLMFTLVIFGKFFVQSNLSKKIFKTLFKNKFLFNFLATFFLVFIFVCIMKTINFDVNTIVKIFNTLTYPEIVSLTSNVLGGNLVFSASLVLSYYWLFIIFLLIFSDESNFKLKNFILFWLPIFLYLLNVIAILITYQNFSFGHFTGKIISGQQGRYFTSYLLLFSIIGASLKHRIKISNLIKNILIFSGAIISVIFTIYAVYIFG